MKQPPNKGFAIFDRESRPGKMYDNLREAVGEDGLAKMNSQHVQDMTAHEEANYMNRPMSKKEGVILNEIGKKFGMGNKKLEPYIAEGDIDHSVFSMDNPGNKEYLYWPYITEPFDPEDDRRIDEATGRDRKKLISEHTTTVKSYNRSAFDRWLNKGL